MARIAGTKNKKTLEAEAIFVRLKCDPLEVLCHVTNGDWKALGYLSPTQTKYAKDGTPYEEETITLDARIQAATQACKYLYPQKKAVEHAIAPGQEGFKIEIHDYGKEKK